MFLYANGDSFVEGIELGDFLISSHPGYYHFNTPRPGYIETWFSQYLDVNHRVGIEREKKRTQIKYEEYTRNFAYKLAKKAKCSDYMNKAIGGSSFERIIRTTMLDLIELKKSNDNIVAVIGTSEPSRMSLPNQGQSWICQSLNTTNDYTRPVMEYYLRNSTDYHAMVSFYKNVIQLQDFCTVNNIKLMWVAGNSDMTEEIVASPETKILIDHADFKYSVSMPDVAREINRNAKAPGYHFTEIVHERTAELLLEQL